MKEMYAFKQKKIIVEHITKTGNLPLLDLAKSCLAQNNPPAADGD